MPKLLSDKEIAARKRKLAKYRTEGLRKSEAARELGMSESALRTFLNKHAPDLKTGWNKARGPKKSAPSTPDEARDLTPKEPRYVDPHVKAVVDRAWAKSHGEPDPKPEGFEDLDGRFAPRPGSGRTAHEPPATLIITDPKFPRPKEWSDELKREFLLELCEGRTVRKILSNRRFPDRWSFYEEILDDGKFADHYARAREISADQKFDMILEIADDASGDFVEDGEGGLMFNREHVNRSKLRVDAYKWIISREYPKKYGDRVDVNVTTVNERPIEEDDGNREALEKYETARNFHF